jgi:hypothetical protein
VNVYIYQAALLCSYCGEAQRRHLDEAFAENGAAPGTDEDDSDRYPQGPYPGGGGEADCPQHCDQCGLFLENPLTPDGDAYVREQAEQYAYPDENGDVATWSEIAERASNDNQPVLAEWIEFYFAPGM